MIWILAFIVIGLFTGLAARRLMPGVVPDRTLWLPVLGIFGALIGGLSSFLLFDYRGTRGYLYDLTDFYDTMAATYTERWVSLLWALVAAILVLAVYKLVRGRLTPN